METIEKPRDYMTIRLNAELKKIIVDTAKREHRSTMQQVIALLEEALNARKAKEVNLSPAIEKSPGAQLRSSRI